MTEKSTFISREFAGVLFSLISFGFFLYFKGYVDRPDGISCLSGVLQFVVILMSYLLLDSWLSSVWTRRAIAGVVFFGCVLFIINSFLLVTFDYGITELG